MAELDFELRTERTDDAVRVTPRGELDLATVEELQGVLARLRADREVILLDLSELTFMDSSGLRALLQAREDAAAEDRILRMVRPDGPALSTLQVSGTEALFDWHDEGAAE